MRKTTLMLMTASVLALSACKQDSKNTDAGSGTGNQGVARQGHGTAVVQIFLRLKAPR